MQLANEENPDLESGCSKYTISYSFDGHLQGAISPGNYKYLNKNQIIKCGAQTLQIGFFSNETVSLNISSELKITTNSNNNT